jgi:hypothetical protein
MMATLTKFVSLALVGVFVLSTTACKKDSQSGGPAEQAGRKIDKAMERAGEEVGKALERGGEAAKRAGQDLQKESSK